jgi:hypothetical protein
VQAAGRSLDSERRRQIAVEQLQGFKRLPARLSVAYVDIDFHQGLVGAEVLRRDC